MLTILRLLYKSNVAGAPRLVIHVLTICQCVDHIQIVRLVYKGSECMLYAIYFEIDFLSFLFM